MECEAPEKYYNFRRMRVQTTQPTDRNKKSKLISTTAPDTPERLVQDNCAESYPS